MPGAPVSVAGLSLSAVADGQGRYPLTLPAELAEAWPARRNDPETAADQVLARNYR